MHTFILIVRPSPTKPKTGRDRSASELHAMGPRFESHLILFFFKLSNLPEIVLSAFYSSLMIMTGFWSFFILPGQNSLQCISIIYIENNLEKKTR